MSKPMYAFLIILLLCAELDSRRLKGSISLHRTRNKINTLRHIVKCVNNGAETTVKVDISANLIITLGASACLLVINNL